MMVPEVLLTAARRCESEASTAALDFAVVQALGVPTKGDLVLLGKINGRPEWGKVRPTWSTVEADHIKPPLWRIDALFQHPDGAWECRLANDKTGRSVQSEPAKTETLARAAAALRAWAAYKDDGGHHEESPLVPMMGSRV